MLVSTPFQKIKSFIPDLQYIEEEPIEGTEYSYESDPDEKFLPDNKLTFEEANADKIDERFSAFLDGTHRLARMGYLAGIPVYVASIAGAVLKRDNLGRLHDIGLLKNLIAIIYPFKSARDYHIEYGNRKIAEDIEEFLNILNDLKSDCILQDFELRGDVTKKLESFTSPTVYIIADISYQGIDERSRKIQIESKDVYNIGSIYRKARARARVLMSILEAAYLKKYRDTFGFDDWILVDGTLNYTHKFFLSTDRQHEAFRKYFRNTVGFVKKIRRRVFEYEPDKLLKFLSMKEGQYAISVSYKTDTDEALIDELDPEKQNEFSVKWGFVYLRFRSPRHLSYYGSLLTNKGIVKLQFTVENNDVNFIIDKGRKIANMTYFERYPLPSDRKRVWNEALAIEEAEKVAKSRLHDYRALESAGVHMIL